MSGGAEHRDVHLDHPPITPHSCKHCQRIVLRREHFQHESNRVELPHTVNEIHQAIEDKCELILLFASAESPAHVLFCSGCSECEDPQAQNLNKLARLKYAPNRSTNWFSDPWKMGSYFYKLRSLCTFGPFSMILEKDECWNFSLRFDDYSWLQPTHLLSGGVEVKAKGVTGKAAVELGSIIAECYNANVASDSSLAQMYQWLTECHSTHALCQQESSDFRPRRLLHLDYTDGKSSIRLADDFQGLQIKWAALSYVWGGEQRFKTTLHSLPDMVRGFGPEVLPQTLQDAVRVCKAMSLDYLWVDSLCIVQDDPEELPHELASMPLIYQRAWVTISASTAACVSDGFLQNRCYSHWGGCRNTRVPISLPYLADDGFGTGEIVFVHASDACRHKAEPINERAWTYQERRLSPRVLDFRYDQVVLYCYTNKRCQGDGSNVSSKLRHSGPALDGRFLWARSAQQDSPAHQDRHTNSLQDDRLYRPCLNNKDLPNWHEIVNAYASRKSTLPSDKLTALSALAGLYRRNTNQTYCVGLWEESLICDLCWGIAGRNLLPRPKAYRAPSFSWAAIDVDAYDETRIYDLDRKYHVDARVKVLGVEIEQDHPNTTYGKILGGFLTLKAPALWIEWHYNDIAVTEIGTETWGVLTFIRDAKENDRLVGGDKVRLLAVLLTQEELWGVGSYINYGLMLMEAANGMFRRIGLFEGHMLRTFEASIPTITIV